MSVYVISEVEILDETAAQCYRELAQASITGYQGRYIVPGARPLRRRLLLVDGVA